MTALAAIPRPYQGKVVTYTGPEGLQGVRIGSQARMLNLYEKGIETGGQVPYGTMRVEAQFRRSWLLRHGVKKLGDLTVETANDLALNAWEWSRMGAEVTNAQTILDLIEGMDLSDTRKAGLQRDLRLLGDGILPPTGYRKKHIVDFIGAHGISADALAGLAPTIGAPITERLDLGTGEVKTTVASSKVGCEV
jgi:hypothetical protein